MEVVKIPDRSDIGRRTRAKILHKLITDKIEHPEKYIKTMSEKSRYLGMKYDYDRRILPQFKMAKFLELKEIYGDED